MSATTTTTTTTTATTTTTKTAPAAQQDEQQPLALTLASRIDQLDRHGFLFGQKLAASMSPLLHAVVYEGLGLNWEQIRLDSTDMDLFLRLIRHPKFYGTSFFFFFFPACFPAR